MLFWRELVQAVTMVPVFAVHLLYTRRTVVQSWVGMIHSVFSYAMHFNTWWQQEEWPDWAVELYIADKCMILAVAWGFHYHMEPRTARVLAIPVLADAVQIALYQHDYVGNRFAYFDVFLLTYLLFVCVIVMLFRARQWELPTSVVLLAMSVVGYGMDIHGLMHLCLAPGFWMWYEIISHTRQEEEKKNVIKKKV
jgi:hypothetical protein